MEQRPIPSLVQRSGILLIGATLGVLGLGSVMLLTSPTRGDPVTLAEPTDLRIHVAGAVLHPGVYELPPGSIVQEAIDAAGGFSTEASQSRVNLAGTLEDGQQVFVPEVSESAPQSADPADSNSQIAINIATAPELERLPGIGPVLAQRIVEYREQNGPFIKMDDLLDVEGIGPSKLETLREYVQVP